MNAKDVPLVSNFQHIPYYSCMCSIWSVLHLFCAMPYLCGSLQCSFYDQLLFKHCIVFFTVYMYTCVCVCILSNKTYMVELLLKPEHAWLHCSCKSIQLIITGFILSNKDDRFCISVCCLNKVLKGLCKLVELGLSGTDGICTKVLIMHCAVSTELHSRTTCSMCDL